MESCGGTNYWARVFQKNEHEVKLISPQFVKPLVETEGKLKKLGKRIKLIIKQNSSCQGLLKIPGVGELTATAIVAAVPNPNEFKNGRHMSAWLGLVPRQASSGNNRVLLGISKRGDKYIRTLLIHGARSALTRCKNTDHEYGRWLAEKRQKLNLNKAAVALANKNARIIWSLLKTGGEFDCNNQRGAT